MVNFVRVMKSNPSDGNFTVKLKGYKNPALEVTVRDLTGKIVLLTNVNKFNLSNRTSGMYLITITIDGKSYNSHIVKK